MNRDAKIFVAGHRGLAGSALVRRLAAGGYTRLVTRTRHELNLCDEEAVAAFFAAERPEVVLLAAARVGGILANEAYPADFIRENLLIQTHVMHQSFLHGVQKLLFLGSSCVYPRLCPQPMKEAHLLGGPLEPTNAAYAVAKIAGIQMCQAYNRQHGTFFLPVMPANLYGPNDNFHPRDSHVLPALIRRFHEAGQRGEPEVAVWGSGSVRREFLHVDDMADACLFLLENAAQPDLVNIGVGREVTVAELAGLVKAAVGYSGRIVFDRSKPDGTPRKRLDVSKLDAMGWRARIALARGIAETYAWFLANRHSLRA
jgi:GDP-L-fucose synthase